MVLPPMSRCQSGKLVKYSDGDSAQANSFDPTSAPKIAPTMIHIFFSNGTKILLLPGEHGKIDPASIERAVKKRSDIHYPKPSVLSITNATELGTVYTPDEVQALCSEAKRFGLKVHMDGARFANAVASLDVPPRRITWEAGIDVLSFGGTKNGIGVGEAVVFFDKAVAEQFDYRCKQAGQLASKMRFLSAPWVGMLRGGPNAAPWLRHAGHANAMAELLESRVAGLPQARILFPRQANSVFVQLPESAIRALHAKGWKFYTFIGQGGCRFMCSWDTTDQDVRALTDDLEAALALSDLPATSNGFASLVEAGRSHVD